MRHEEFFQQIEHVEVPWGSKTIFFPVFYYDVATLSVQLLAPITKIKPLLPSSRLHPLRITPWHCVVSISALEYRDSDIGPYNEVSIGIPVMLDEPSPVFVGTFRQVPAVPKMYIHHLPVTTEIAYASGVELAGYPKFLAEITFERDGEWVKCHLNEAGQHILTLTARTGVLSPTPRSRLHPITVRQGHLLRSELVVSERNQSTGRGSGGFQLELGEHPIAQELKEWELGKVLAYQFAPHHQAILTPVIESFAV
ncbi:acetoacetate decarboxylase family protein [Pantanalinema sp. GBBB05]|uniref:acetoacetate decarboxylase family protein n=1 Tax=Pantanalinema sp. GBBB05 TaxID=2604139 RepID=UPI001DF6F6E0|nr:hypothetical protein [Pantanalinema sp. GBBB05]